MNSEPIPSVGAWYVGEHHAGAYRVIHCDAACGVIYLKAADGRRVRMTYERWSRHPMHPAQDDADTAFGPDHFEWHEPPIG